MGFNEISLKYNPEHIAEIRWLLAIYKPPQVLQFGYEALSHFEIALDGCQPSLRPFLAIAFDEPEKIHTHFKQSSQDGITYSLS